MRQAHYKANTNAKIQHSQSICEKQNDTQ